MVCYNSLFIFAVILTTQYEALAGHVIGIDLGTSYSRVAVYRDGEVEIIPTKRGNLHTPSYVAFSGSSVLRGDDAKDQFHLNPENTIYSFKRYLGMLYEEVEEWTTTYQVVNYNGRAAFQVDYNGKQTTFTPEEVTAQLLIELTESAEAYLGSKVTDAVVSVSGGSYNLQRQATLDAAKVAGLNVIRLVNAATATGISYSMNTGDEKLVAIVDMGGGAPDFSIAILGDGICYIEGTTDIARSLTGDAIDHFIMGTIVQKVKQEYNVDLRSQPQTVQQLKTAAENAKIALSSHWETMVTISSNNRDMSVTINRDTLTMAASEAVGALAISVTDVLNSIGYYTSDIDDTVIVGGSTQIPYVSKLLSQYFESRADTENKGEFTVVTGAAIAGAMDDGVLPPMLILDVLPRAIGLEGVNHYILPILHRFSAVPNVQSEVIASNSDNANVILVNVYEGISMWNINNHLLGSLKISGIPPGQPRGFRVGVNFEVDQNGICDFTLEDSTYDLLVENGRLSEDEIRNMAAKAPLL